MRIEVVTTKEEFYSLRTSWNSLLSQSSADTIFLTWEWLSSWWESYFQAGSELLIVLIYEDVGTLVGIIPLCLKSRDWMPFRRLKVLQFLGDGSWDSDYLDMIVASGREEETVKTLWDYLHSERRLWDVMELTGIPEHSVALQWLKRSCALSGGLLRCRNVSCTVARLPTTWEEYVASLNPRFRTKIRGTLRELEKKYAVRFYAVESESGLTSGLDGLFELHERRWNLKGLDGVFTSAAKRRFYHRFLSECLKQGWLAFHFLELNGKRVACQLCFRYKCTQFLLQEGFDPAFASDSVGIALRAMVFRNAIDDGIESYDFLAGTGRHKSQWGGQVKGCQNVIIGRKTLLARIYIETPVYIEAVKEWGKAFLPVRAVETIRRFPSLLKAIRVSNGTEPTE